MGDQVLLYAGEALRRYGFGQGHPFGPDRYDVFWQRATALGLPERTRIAPPVAADDALLARFHTAAYIAHVRRQSYLGSGWLDGGDTPVFPGIFDAAAAVVGSTVDACRRVMDAQARRAFIPIAGLHHARRDAAAGFCAFNDCGVALEVLHRDYGLERIAYVDIDAHHGDGVFYAFEDQPWLIFADLHEDGRYLYPGTGAASEIGRAAGRGYKLNIPMPPDKGDEAFMPAFERVVEFLDGHRPQFILFQCGADGISGDPLTHLRYSTAAHAHAARELVRLADRHAEGRMVTMGGGGYNRDNIALAWCAVLQTLLEGP